MNQVIESIEIKIGTSQDYINTNTLNPVTYIYYIIAVDGNIILNNALPLLDSTSVKIFHLILYLIN
jgi:hypothetical protein